MVVTFTILAFFTISDELYSEHSGTVYYSDCKNNDFIIAKKEVRRET